MTAVLKQLKNISTQFCPLPDIDDSSNYIVHPLRCEISFGGLRLAAPFVPCWHSGIYRL